MINRLYTLLFPTTCFGCKTGNLPLCDRCLALSRKALSTPHPYIASIFDFKDPFIKKTIHAIKYYHRKDLVRPLAKLLAQEIIRMPDYYAYILVPIPMPRIRKLSRGYNQAELLSQELSLLLGIKTDSDILQRSKHLQQQAKVHNRSDRIQNQRESFRIHAFVPPKIILIDDVTTTGATLAEARKMLLANHAEDVRAYTLAH